MAQGAQEEIAEQTNPVEYTYEKKLTICKTFIRTKSSFKAEGVLKHVIDLGFVKPMEKVRDFRHSEAVKDQYGNVIGYKKAYSDQEVRNYFDWLVGIVAGLEEVKPDVFKNAVEQLHTFLFHLRPYIVTDEDPFATPIIGERLDIISEQLKELFTEMDRRDDNIAGILTRINELLAKYLTIFEKVEKEASLVGRVQSLDKKS